MRNRPAIMRIILKNRVPTYPQLHHRRYADNFFLGFFTVSLVILSASFYHNALQQHRSLPNCLLLFIPLIILFIVVRYILASPKRTLELILFLKRIRQRKLGHRRTHARYRSALDRLGDITYARRLEKRFLQGKIRWLFLADVPVVVLMWLYALVLAWISRPISPDEPRIILSLITWLVFALGLVPYALLVFDALRLISPHRSAWIILIAPCITGGLLALLLYPPVPFTPFIVITGLYVSIFVFLRINVGSDVLSRLLYDHLNDITQRRDINELYETVVRRIRNRLRFGRVSILVPKVDPETNDVKELEIAHQSQPYFSIKGQHKGHRVPIANSLTGLAWQRQKTVAWNDVSKAGNLYHKIGEEDEAVAAEVAIPLVHEKQSFAVLDIQSPYKHVFRTEDLRTLEIIARTLAAHQAEVEALEQLRHFIEELWHSHEVKEETLFSRFAKHALRVFKADLVVYYPLSPSWMPVKDPLFEGDYTESTMSAGRLEDLKSPLIRLIQDWKPLFEAQIGDDSPLIHPERPAESFPRRHGYKSACFLPIGMQRDRLAALFLNFRRPTLFEPLQQLQLLNFSLVFGTALARLRYREFFYHGFGRPDLGLHSLRSSTGLKQNPYPIAMALVENYCNQPNEENKRKLEEYLEQVNNFINRVTVADEALSPDFWGPGRTLKKSLEDYLSAFPPYPDGSRVSSLLSVSPKIDRESAWFKTILFQVISEAINNAIVHGQPSQVNVSIERLPHLTVVEISNNGKPLPLDSQNRRGKRGIFSILERMESELGAKTRIQVGPQDLGCVVSLEIPCLPET